MIRNGAPANLSTLRPTKVIGCERLLARRAARRTGWGHVVDMARSVENPPVEDAGYSIGSMWVLVESLGMDAEWTLGVISYPPPPERIFEEADRLLGLNGRLLDHAARTRIVPERIPHITDVERAAYLTRRVGSEQWSSFHVYCDNLRYTLVIAHHGP